jgi:hypothetical protein
MEAKESERGNQEFKCCEIKQQGSRNPDSRKEIFGSSDHEEPRCVDLTSTI